MIWLMVIIAVIAFAIMAFSASKNAKAQQTQSEFQISCESRARAYADYLRRTSESAEIKSMGEHEIVEFIAKNIKEYNAELASLDSTGRFIGKIFGAALLAGFFAAYYYWSVEYLAFTVIGGLVGYFVLARLAGAMDRDATEGMVQKYRQRGLDVEQLKLQL